MTRLPERRRTRRCSRRTRYLSRQQAAQDEQEKLDKAMLGAMLSWVASAAGADDTGSSLKDVAVASGRSTQAGAQRQRGQHGSP
jgi:hypothetical protein